MYRERKNLWADIRFNIVCSLGVLAVALLSVNIAAAQEKKLTKDEFVSEASFIVATYKPDQLTSKEGQTPKSQADAGNAFLDSLDKELRSKARHALASPERTQWTNLPARPDAGGVRFGELNADQVRAACDLMATLMSPSGYQKMIDIMIADDQLLNGGRPRQGFGTEYFSIVIFGKPSSTDPWGFQLDGHHVGVNISVKGSDYSMSPSFIGTQPETFKVGKEISPMKNEVKDAYDFLGLLDDGQSKKAVLSDTRGDLRAGPGADWRIPTAEGLDASELDSTQKRQLLKLISNWLDNMPKDFAAARLESIEKELPKMKFGWRGSKDFGKSFSFSIQSPSLIIEHACQGNSRRPREHMHSIYRNPSNEYGLQIKSGESGN